MKNNSHFAILKFGKKKKQVFAAAVISVMYGLVMVVVATAISISVVEDGLTSPSSMFLFFVAFQMFITGCLHPREVGCLIYGLIYYITVPSMYCILIIYSLFNLNDITWGTREVRTKKSAAVINKAINIIHASTDIFFCLINLFSNYFFNSRSSKF